MSDAPQHGFDTMLLHAGTPPDPATGAVQTPIYQSTSFVFQDADHAARLFNLEEVGFIYSRLTNPTVLTCRTASPRSRAAPARSPARRGTPRRSSPCSR